MLRPMQRAMLALLAAGALAASLRAQKPETGGNAQAPAGIHYPRIGAVAPRHAREIQSSNWSIGCEVMDRDYTVYKNWREYLGPLGFKRARIQSGWAKTEKTPGKYDFAWLDEIVRDMAKQGVKPWVCLCYGNPLYAPAGGNDKKGRGVAELGAKLPLEPKAAAAWLRYVAAVVDRYKDVVEEWEIWNEPRGGKAGAPDYIRLFVPTAELIRRHQPQARIIGFATAGTDTALIGAGLEILRKDGKLDLLDQVTYHPYTYNPDEAYEKVAQLRGIVAGYSPRITIFQGENGAPSEPSSSNALGNYEWSEERQAKWALRRLLGDLGRDIPSSYFTICNYKYGFTDRLNTKGLLATNPGDKTVRYAKPSYYALQRVAAIFDDRLRRVRDFGWSSAPEMTSKTLSVFAYADAQGRQAVTLWRCDAAPQDTEIAGVDLAFPGAKFKDPVYVDMLGGGVYEIPAAHWRREETGVTFKRIPVFDSVVLIAERGLIPLKEN